MLRPLVSVGLGVILLSAGICAAPAQTLRPGSRVIPAQTVRPGSSVLPAQTVRPVPRGTRPLPQHQVRVAPIPAALSWQAVRTGPHTIYGIIAALQGNIVTVRTRNGGLTRVNATAAIAHGDFSAPLFLGKVVAVDGAIFNGTFIAAHLFRLENLSQLPNDH